MNAILLLGLGLVGERFAKLKTVKKEDLKVSPIKQIQNSNGNDIYESRDLENAYKDQFRRAYVKKQDSIDYGRTGVIAPEWNHIEKQQGKLLINDVVQDPSSLITQDRVSNLIETQKQTNDIEDFLGAELKITDTLTNEEKFFRETLNDSSYTEQFAPLTFDNPGGPVAGNAIPMSTNRLKMLDTERQMGLEQGWSTFNKNKNMTYNVTPAQYFVHNNMTPQFAKGSYGDNSGAYDKVKQQKLELFTGSSNQAGVSHKKEMAPFFDPVTGASNPYGMPTVVGNQLDRYAMSLKDERKAQSEKPFEPIRVNVGLDLDNYEHGSDGYHPYYRPLIRGVDELRIATKPKLPLGNVVIPGMKSQGNRAVQAAVNKNRPETFYEQDPEDILRTYGYIQMPTVRGNYYLPTTLKEQSTVAYAGNPYGAGGQTVDQNMPESMFPKIKMSDKNQYITPDNQPLYGNHGLSRSNHQIGQNERSTTVFSHPTGLTGHVNPLGLGFVVDPKNVPSVCIKETTLYDGQKFGVLDSAGKQSYAYDPSDTLRTTNKELTLFDNAQYAILGAEYKPGMAYNINDVPKTTLKETILDKVRSNNIIGTILGTITPTDQQKTTLRQITSIDGTKFSHIAPEMSSKTPAFDYHNQQRTTVKETTINAIQAGNISGSASQNKGDVNNYFAKTTGKQLIENSIQGGYISGGFQNHGDMNNYDAKITGRQLIENTVYAPTIGGSAVNNQGGYQYNHYEAPNTLRQLTENKVQAGNISGSSSQNHGNQNHYEAKTTNKQLIENSIQGGYVSSVQNYNANDSTNIYVGPTVKQSTANVMYMGTQSNGVQAPGGYQSNKYYAGPTVKQSTVNYLHIGGPGSEVSEHAVYDQYYNMTLDDRKEILALSGRKPTLSNYNKISTTDMTEYRLRDDTKRIVYRDVMSEAYTANPLQQTLPGCDDRLKSYIPQESVRLDPAILNALMSNAYAIPLVSSYIDCSQPLVSKKGYTGYTNPYSDKQIKQKSITVGETPFQL